MAVDVRAALVRRADDESVSREVVERNRKAFALGHRFVETPVRVRAVLRPEIGLRLLERGAATVGDAEFLEDRRVPRERPPDGRERPPESPICRSSVARLACGLMSQASRCVAARATAGSPLAAIHTGGCGRCTDWSVSTALCRRKCRPSYVTSASVQSRRAISSDSRKRGTRVFISTPNASNSSGRYPSPTPKMKRPPEITSSVATCSAT